METVQAERTPEFLAGLPEPGVPRALRARAAGGHDAHLGGRRRRLGVRGHVHEREGCGEVVPGTGIHLNNMMGEQDLSPFGFHAHPPGRRLPSMMAPTMVLADGEPRLVLGSAGSNRIRSAILQVIVGVLDHGRAVQAAIDAPRIHIEDGIAYVEPGSDTAGLKLTSARSSASPPANLFFGGAQAVSAIHAPERCPAAAIRAAAERSPWPEPAQSSLHCSRYRAHVQRRAGSLRSCGANA